MSWMVVLLVCMWVSRLVLQSQGLTCRYEMDLKAYPHNYKRSQTTCTGQMCVFMNVTYGQDPSKKVWSGSGWGCEPPDRPLCASMGAVNGCMVPKWSTFSLFGIATITVRDAKNGMICCCNTGDNCDPSAGNTNQGGNGKGDGGRKPPDKGQKDTLVNSSSQISTLAATSPTTTSTSSVTLPKTVSKALGVSVPQTSVPTDKQQCPQCECTCPSASAPTTLQNLNVVNGSRPSIKNFNIGIFLGVYICVVATAVVISPSYMLARCLPPE